MSELLDFIKTFDLHTIIAMGLIMWFFSRDIKNELKGSIDNLDKDVREMNTRLSRVEGTIYGKNVYKTLRDEKDE